MSVKVYIDMIISILEKHKENKLITLKSDHNLLSENEIELLLKREWIWGSNVYKLEAELVKFNGELRELYQLMDSFVKSLYRNTLTKYVGGYFGTGSTLKADLDVVLLKIKNEIKLNEFSSNEQDWVLDPLMDSMSIEIKSKGKSLLECNLSKVEECAFSQSNQQPQLPIIASEKAIFDQNNSEQLNEAMVKLAELNIESKKEVEKLPNKKKQDRQYLLFHQEQFCKLSSHRLLNSALYPCWLPLANGTRYNVKCFFQIMKSNEREKRKDLRQKPSHYRK